MKNFLKLIVLYGALFLVAILHYTGGNDVGAKSKVNFEYQQF